MRARGNHFHFDASISILIGLQKGARRAGPATDAAWAIRHPIWLFSDKIGITLKNFFQPDKILQLRELALKEVATRYKITTICIGKPHLNLYNVIIRTALFNQLLTRLAATDIDVVILS
ncbi:MAG TPA: hypothetical protein VFE32_08185 [Puia sp.]|jgi:K+-sensing histidine kinase KdpD|nr:hypothetical protein [Puia sp.]